MKTPPPPSVQTDDHGQFVLKAMQMKGQKVVTARAFRRDGPPGIVAEAQGSTTDEALETLKGDLDASIAAVAEETAREKASRRETSEGPVPTTVEFRRVLESARVAPRHMEMLRAHAKAGDHGMTLGDLAHAAGYKDSGAAALQYGRLAWSIAEALDENAFLSRYKANKRGAIALLAVPGAERGDDPVWIIHPELASAVQK